MENRYFTKGNLSEKWSEMAVNERENYSKKSAMRDNKGD